LAGRELNRQHEDHMDSFMMEVSLLLEGCSREAEMIEEAAV
jgi:hypothetical protein